MTEVKQYEEAGYYHYVGNINKDSLYNVNSDTHENINRIPYSIRNEVLSKLPKVSGVTFKPCEPALIPSNDGFSLLVNRYRAYEYKTDADADLDLFHEFMIRLFPDTTERLHITKYVAHLVQHPQERPMYGLLLTGASGSGKSTFCSILNNLVSNQVAQENNYARIFDKFSSCFHGTLLLTIDDAIPKASDYERLKSNVTSRLLPREVKGEMRSIEPTFTRIIINSNRTAPLQLDGDDRRFYCPAFQTHKVSQEETSEFMSDFLNLLYTSDNKPRTNYFDSLHRYFMSIPLNSFNANLPPMTQTKQDMIGIAEQTSGKSLIEDFIAEGNKVFKWDEIERYFSGSGYVSRELKDLLNSLGYTQRKISVKDEGRSYYWFSSSWTNRDAVSYLTEEPFTS